MTSFNVSFTNEVGSANPAVFGPKLVPLVYQKIEAVFHERITTQVSVGFCEQIVGTNLVDEKATPTNLLRAIGVNCYAFAVGRTPEIAHKIENKDPIPGGNLIREIRQGIVQILSSRFRGSRGQAWLEPLRNLSPHKKIDLYFSLLADQQQKPPVEVFMDFIRQLEEDPADRDLNLKFKKFCSVYYLAEDLNFEELYQFLTKEYKVHPHKMNPQVISNLLETDGLIKAYPLTDEQIISLQIPLDCFGNFLIAVFVGGSPEPDYHFVRLFNDGWYERSGDIIQKRRQAPDGVPQDIDPNRVRETFYPDGEKEFVGYFIVPITVSVVDGIGKKFIFESRKY